MNPQKLLVVFDFDWSLINENSDTYIVKELSPELYDEMKLIKNTQWTDLMNLMFEKLHMSGKGREDFISCLNSIPFESSMMDTLKHLTNFKAELRILSDANTFFIDTILKSYNISHHFTTIVTNPSHFDSKGLLRVERYHPETSEPHGCDICGVNLCKGKVLQTWNLEEYDVVLYIGDGRADFCPVRQLRKSDFILARKGWTMHKLVVASQLEGKVTATVHEWESGDDVLRIATQLLPVQR